MTIAEIGKLLKTQNNRFTAHPIFMVQEERTIYGIGAEYDPQIVWLYEDGCVRVDEKLASRLERMYHNLNSKYFMDDCPRGYRRVGYTTQWINVQPFFTERGAEEYIRVNGHNHGKLRIYVASAYRNAEWQAIRQWLMEAADA